MELTAISDEKQFDALIEMFNSVCCHDPVEKCLKLLNPKIDDENDQNDVKLFSKNSRIVGSYTVHFLKNST